MIGSKTVVFVELDQTYDVALIEAAKFICLNHCKSVYLIREERSELYGAFAGSDLSWTFGGIEGQGRRVIVNMTKKEFEQSFGSVIDSLMEG